MLQGFACYNLIILALKYRKPISIRKHFNSFFGVNVHAQVSATPLVFVFFHWEMPSRKEVKLTVSFCSKVCCFRMRTVDVAVLLFEAWGGQEACLSHAPSRPLCWEPRCPRHLETHLLVPVSWCQHHPQPWTILPAPGPLLPFRCIFYAAFYLGPSGSVALRH